MGNEYPTKWPIRAEFTPNSDSVDPPSELTSIPWIDIHNHAHTLSWNEREKFALSGCRAMVMMAAAHYWAPYQPVSADNIRYLWDDALNRLDHIRQAHFYDAKLALGIHTRTPTEDYQELLDTLRTYLGLSEVAAIGETGITSTQEGGSWSLETQKDLVRSQMRIANEYDRPIIIHTPSNADSINFTPPKRGGISGFETSTQSQQDPLLDPERAGEQAVEIDVALKDQAGLADDAVVFSHADPDITPYVMENTACYCSYTISYPWLLGVTAADVAAAIERYGPDRIMMETDSVGVIKSDVFSMRRSIFELYRHGIDIDDIRTVVFENPKEVADLGT